MVHRYWALPLVLSFISVWPPSALPAQVVAPVALHARSLVRAVSGPRGRELPRGRDSAGVRDTHYGLVLAGVLVAATGNQVIGSPSGWPRTWGGYGSRVGDQLAFAIIEEGVRLSVGATVNWVPDTMPCVRATDERDGVEPGLIRRAGCAIRQTVLQRTPTGAARPNLPFLTGVVVASVASVQWRPEGKDPVKARALVATRISVVLGASAATQMVTTWWQDRRRAR